VGTIQAVVGSQFGSEGKGAVGAYLGRNYEDGDCFVRVAGPNAGHTAYDAKGVAFAFRQLPVASVVNGEAEIVIAAGSEIEPAVLASEISLAESHGHSIRERLVVDPHATVITDEHKAREASLVGAIGSTGKGIGAARADRLMRKAITWGEWASENDHHEEFGVTGDTARMLNHYLEIGNNKVMLEGTQGYGLGLHTRYYPQVTSSDCRAIDFLAMAGINPYGHNVEVWLATRVYPIRVAGNSGPLKGETTWGGLGLKEERTTVTKKVRRVGGWDSELVRRAVQANGPAVSRIALTMLDQHDPEVESWQGPHGIAQLPTKSQEMIHKVQDATGCLVALAGTSPWTMIEVVQ
jgi:adenylosuccinate synthase